MRNSAVALSARRVSQGIGSAYDVRLLADQVEGGAATEALPESRMWLYEAMLATASLTEPRDERID